MGYASPRLIFKYDTHELMKRILETKEGGENFYAYIRTTDDAQHLSGDILAMLCTLDDQLEDLRARCRAQEGRDLEILILSDHGNNKAGPPKRVPVRKFLKENGYRITKSLQQPKDVVLPTAGIETWVEIHNAPADTLALADQLTHMEGVDVLTARVPGQDNRFLVLNPKGERAIIAWNAAKDSYRYTMESGDPLGYAPVIHTLASKGRLDAEGFAPSDAWMAETMTNHYPIALERIVRGHTHVTLNPATILISLDNHYAHAAWLILKGSERVTFGGTHGALDDINSTGIILSNFAPTQDTCTRRVAALNGGFTGLRDYRAQENGAEWINSQEQALTSVARSPVDSGCHRLPSDKVYLRVWGPDFVKAGAGAQLDLTIRRVPRYACAEVRRGDPQPCGAGVQHLSLTTPFEFADSSPCERVYDCPPT